MFEAVNPPARSRREQFVTLAVSIVAHLAVVGVLLILPLLYFADQLPTPPDMMAFVVEAAPADVARQLLADEELRRDLLALRPWKIGTADRMLRIERNAHVSDPAEAVALVEIAARIGAGVRPAQAAADAALEAAAPRAGAPFRGEVDASGVQAAKHARVDEVVALARVRERRTRRERLVAAAIAVAAIVLFAVLAAAR